MDRSMAGCRYRSRSRYSYISLTSNPDCRIQVLKFVWFIPYAILRAFILRYVMTNQESQIEYSESHFQSLNKACDCHVTGADMTFMSILETMWWYWVSSLSLEHQYIDPYCSTEYFFCLERIKHLIVSKINIILSNQHLNCCTSMIFCVIRLGYVDSAALASAIRTALKQYTSKSLKIHHVSTCENISKTAKIRDNQDISLVHLFFEEKISARSCSTQKVIRECSILIFEAFTSTQPLPHLRLV
jgi:hypothetical protein